MTAPLLAAFLGLGLLATLVSKLLGAKKGPIFLNKGRQSVPLAERTMLSHDTIRFRFALPQKNSVLGLPVGKHFKLFAPNPKGSVAGQWNGRDDPEAEAAEIERKYTPTSSDHDLGYADLVIKVSSVRDGVAAVPRCGRGRAGTRPPSRRSSPHLRPRARLPPRIRPARASGPPPRLRLRASCPVRRSGLRERQAGALPRRRQDVAVPRLAQGGRPGHHLGPMGHERVQGALNPLLPCWQLSSP